MAINRSFNGDNRKGVLEMKRSILRVEVMAHVVPAWLTFVTWSPANGAMQFSSYGWSSVQRDASFSAQDAP
jgi:hypothetical protein